jgi:transposase
MVPTEIALEACAGSHHWGRTLRAMGHQVKLIPPQYVKPFVKRSKNDRNDAEAINEAASRPSMRTAPVRTVDEQAATTIVKHREMLTRRRHQSWQSWSDNSKRCSVTSGICNSSAIS